VQPLSLVFRLSLALLGACLVLNLSSTNAFSAQPGALDLSFDAQLSEFGAVYVIVAQPDGQLLIGGSFESVGGVPRANVARLNPDGTLDSTFRPGTAVDIGSVSAITVDQNGRILLGGSFSSSDYSAPSNLARLNSDGTVDYSLDPAIYLDGPVNAVAVQDEDYLVIAGGFVYVNGYLRRNVARLHQDGTLDFAFDACVASTAGLGASALALLPDGHILVTGKFQFAGNRFRNGIAKLESCGDLDPTYAAQPGINTNAEVYTLALLTNGNVLLGGNFVFYNDQPRFGLAELDADGLLLTSFNPGLGVQGGTVYTLAVQSDQKRFMGGDFYTYSTNAVPSLGRINPDATLDPTFNPAGGPNNAVSSIQLLADGRLLVAGRFSTYDGTLRFGLARVHGDLGPGQLTKPFRQPNGYWQLSFRGEPEMHYSIEASLDLVNWKVLTNFTAPAAALSVLDNTGNSYERRFYRAVTPP
jgi:uncharacterized delta-60 repeat protein